MVQGSKTRFIAIAVGQGDAFFFERNSTSALIDGGRSRVGFPIQFRRVTGLDGVDILVCTHNDADHALGLLGFLESGLTAKEVWLPASWSDRLDDLLLHPSEFVSELILNIEEIEISRKMRLDDLGDYYSVHEQEIDYEQMNEVTMEDLENALEMASEVEDPWNGVNLLSPPWYYYPLPRLYWRNYERFSLFIEALSAATRIRQISLAAFRSGALIRWFDFIGNREQDSSGGRAGFLIPVNAQEVTRIHRPRRSALMYLALTKSNRESLVFMAPSTDDSPAILFTADSDLSFNQPISWTPGMLITAPHHGSEKNKKAYDRFRRETCSNIKDVTWVRSDGRFKGRPGPSYLQAPGTRYCTICRGSMLPKQNVRLVSQLNTWQPISTRTCCCK